MADGLLEAVRGLRLEDPELGPKPLLAKLREQQPDLGAGNKEVREALLALKAESKATEAAAAAPPAAAAAPPVAAAPPAAAAPGATRASEHVAVSEPRLLRLRPAAVRDGRRSSKSKMSLEWRPPLEASCRRPSGKTTRGKTVG